MYLISFLIALCFVAIWMSASVIIHQAKWVAHYLRFSTLLFSFFVLGILTSLPEISLTVTSLFLDAPSLSIGALIGGQLFLTLALIPTLALVSGGIRFKKTFESPSLFMVLSTIFLPSLLFIDQQMSWYEGLVLSFFTVVSVMIMLINQPVMNTLNQLSQKKRSSLMRLWMTLLILIGGVVVIALASYVLVSQLELVVTQFNLHPFFLSLILVSLGNNLPEVSIAIHSVLLKSKDVAIGDYFGSALVNTVIIAILSLTRPGLTIEFSPLLLTVLFGLGLGMHWWFARTKKTLSAAEGAVLLFTYVVIIGFAIVSEVAL